MAAVGPSPAPETPWQCRQLRAVDGVAAGLRLDVGMIEVLALVDSLLRCVRAFAFLHVVGQVSPAEEQRRPRGDADLLRIGPVELHEGLPDLGLELGLVVEVGLIAEVLRQRIGLDVLEWAGIEGVRAAGRRDRQAGASEYQSDSIPRFHASILPTSNTIRGDPTPTSTRRHASRPGDAVMIRLNPTISVEHANDPSTRQSGWGGRRGAESVAILKANQAAVKAPGS